MTDGIKIMSLNELFSKLHYALLSFSDAIGGTIKINDAISRKEIKDLRDGIIAKLNKGQDVAENEKILKVLNLFVEDKETLSMVKADTEEWLLFLGEIEKHLTSKGEKATDKEIEELENLKELTSAIKSLIRK